MTAKDFVKAAAFAKRAALKGRAENMLDYKTLTAGNSTTAVNFIDGGVRVTQNAAANNAMASKKYVDMKAGHVYTLSCVVTAAAAPANGWRIGFGNKAETVFLAASALSTVTGTPKPVSVSYTPEEDTMAILRLFAKNGGAAADTADATFTDIMLSVDAPDAGYVPYEETRSRKKSIMAALLPRMERS